MRLKKRDLFAVVGAALVATVLIIASTGSEKAKGVPPDDKHRAFYEAMKKGGDRVETERQCLGCHNPQAIPLPRNHPPKEQCLLCHKLARAT